MRCFRLMGLGLLGLLAGCTVGPDYQAPRTHPPDHWAEAATRPAATQPAGTARSRPVSNWWRTFNDPQLTRLIRQARAGSLDLRQARLRVLEARARRGVAAGGKYPRVKANGSYLHRRVSQNGLASSIGGTGGSESGPDSAGGEPAIPGRALSEFDLYQAGFDASWELDLFGRVHRQVQAAEAKVGAAVENLRGVRVTLAGEVARQYLKLRGVQRRRAIAQSNLTAQRRTLDLIRSQQQAGLTSARDADRAAARVARTKARLPRLRTQIQQTIHRLSVLLGQSPQTLADKLAEPAPLPDIPPSVPVGLPTSLLRRRPDIREAERRLAAATAEVGVAVARLFPQFSLTGSFGFQSTEADELARWQSRFFGLGPALRMPIFQGGRLRATVRVRKARRARALNRYRQAVLRAMREVEDTLVAYREEQARRQSLAKAVAKNREAVRLARDLYQQGLGDYLAVLDAQRALLESEDQHAISVQRVRTNLVALYKALGGGWQAPANPSRSPNADEASEKP